MLSIEPFHKYSGLSMANLYFSIEILDYFFFVSCNPQEQLYPVVLNFQIICKFDELEPHLPTFSGDTQYF